MGVMRVLLLSAAFYCFINCASLSPIKKRKSFADLPVELILMICEDFTLADLNLFASINPHTHRIASIVFNAKFGNELLGISRKGIEINIYGQYPENIGNMDVMYSTLKTFGSQITNLEIDYKTFSEWESGKINGRITKFLSNSLAQITFHNVRNDHCKDLTGPLTKVENVTFRDCYIYSEVINLTDVFPAVRSLHFADYQAVDDLRMIINHHYPNLIEIKQTMFDENAAKLEQLFRLNPQVRILTVPRIKWATLNMVSEILPNLERLSIEELNIFGGSGSIHFENLKSLQLTDTSSKPETRGWITFGDDFEEIIDWTSDNYLLSIVLQNKNLKRVFAHNYDFQSVTGDQLPNLEEFHTDFGVYEPSVVDEVIRFVESAMSLKRMELGSCGPTSAADIHERIKDNWDMVIGRHDRHFIFIRR